MSTFSLVFADSCTSTTHMRTNICDYSALTNILSASMLDVLPIDGVLLQGGAIYVL